jgi:hypothetical protein
MEALELSLSLLLCPMATVLSTLQPSAVLPVMALVALESPMSPLMLLIDIAAEGEAAY